MDVAVAASVTATAIWSNRIERPGLVRVIRRPW
jgi:hypothetical protein